MARRTKKGGGRAPDTREPDIGRNKFKVAQMKRDLQNDLEGVVYYPPEDRAEDWGIQDDFEVIEGAPAVSAVRTEPAAVSMASPRAQGRVAARLSGFARENDPTRAPRAVMREVAAYRQYRENYRAGRVPHWADTALIDDERGPATPTPRQKMQAAGELLRDRACKQRPSRRSRKVGAGARRAFVPWCK